jgi:hypothetical protein
MEKSLQEKFDNINLDAIPDSLRFELETIQDETDNFKDEDAIEVFQKNFNYLYFTIGKKYPTALKDYTPPAPTAEELEAKRKQDEFDGFINSGNDKVEAKDFDGALVDFNHALSLGVDNEIASNKISGTERLKADAESERVKQEKIKKAKDLADKYKKKETA